MKLCEIVVHMDIYNFTKFHQNEMKNKKVLLIARFYVQNFKVSVESWKLYIVHFDHALIEKKLNGELDTEFINYYLLTTDSYENLWKLKYTVGGF